MLLCDFDPNSESSVAWQQGGQQPTQQSLSVVTTVWGVTQTSESNSLSNNSMQQGPGMQLTYNL